jgi:hypothetical protein
MENQSPDIQYVSNRRGKPIAVMISMELWREIVTQLDQCNLPQSELLQQCLAEAKLRQDFGHHEEEVCEEAENIN